LRKGVSHKVLLVASVNNTVIDNDFHETVLQSVVRETVPRRLFYEAGFDLILQIKGNRFVCRSKTSIVASGTQELKDGTFATWTYRNKLQKFDVFAVVFVLLKVSKYRFLLENIPGRSVYIFRASTKKEDVRC
jgi:hypothetical protein